MPKHEPFGAYEAKVHLFMAIWFHIFPPFYSPVHMINKRSCFLCFFIFSHLKIC